MFFRQVGVGVTAVLAVGLLAAGCSEDGDTIVMGGGALLNNSDQFNASSIMDGNTAPDGGGFSIDNADVTAGNYKVFFNGGSAGDNSAIILIKVVDNSGDQHLFGSYYANNSLTPLVELEGYNKDDAAGFDFNSIVAVPLNTSSWNLSTDSAINSAVTQKSGNWLILWTHTTDYQDTTQTDQTQTGRTGVRRVLVCTRFLQGLASQVTASSEAFSTGTTLTYRHGFQREATLVNTVLKAGGVAAVAPGGLAVPAEDVLSFGVVTDTYRGEYRFGGSALPFSGNGAGDAKFTHAKPNLASKALDAFSGTVGDATKVVHCFFTQIASTIGGATSNSYCVDDNTGGNTYRGGHYIQMRHAGFDLSTGLFVTDAEVALPTSRHGGDAGRTRPGTQPFTDFVCNNTHVMFKYADASLGVDRSGTNYDPLQITPADAATNQDWVQDETGGHEGMAMANKGFWEEIGCHGYVYPNTTTPQVGAIGSLTDLSDSLMGTISGGVSAHTLTNPTINTAEDVYPADREMFNFNKGRMTFGPDMAGDDLVVLFVSTDNSNASTDGNIDRFLGCAVFLDSATEPLGSLTTNPCRVSSHERDYHGQNGAGATAGARQGTDPIEENTTSSASVLRDPIVPNFDANGSFSATRDAGNAPNSNDFFTATVNRTGHYAFVTWLQDVGISSPASPASTGTGSFHQSLQAKALQFYRQQLWVSDSSSAATMTQVGPAARFSATIQVEPTSGTDFGNGGTTSTNTARAGIGSAWAIAPGGRDQDAARGGAETSANWDQIPVNAYVHQLGVNYGCGVQSDWTKIGVMFEMSDATEDRLWVRQFQVTPSTGGTPTMVATSAAIEIEPTRNVAADRNFSETATQYSNRGSTNHPPAYSHFRLIDRTAVQNGSFMGGICDAGYDGQATPNGGDLLVLYQRINDATNVDTDNADIDLLARRITFSDTAPLGAAYHIGTGVDQNADIGTANINAGVGNFGPGSCLVSVNGWLTTNALRWNMNGFGADIAANPVFVAKNSDLGTQPSYPTTSAGYWYVLMRDRLNNTTSSSILVARVFKTGYELNESGTAHQFYLAWTPPCTGGAASTAPSGNTSVTSADFVKATRLDHEIGVTSDPGDPTIATNSSSVLVLWKQNDHLWAQSCSDGGSTWLYESGVPSPILVDNWKPEDVSSWSAFFNYPVCDADDGVLIFTKFDSNDVNKDERAHVRHSIRP